MGRPDLDKKEKDLATQCASKLNRAVRPDMAVERVDGKTLVGCRLLAAQGVPRSDRRGLYRYRQFYLAYSKILE